MYVAEGKRTGWRANIADALLSPLCASTALHPCSRVALTAAQGPAEGQGALRMLCWLVEPCTSPRWLLGELVCICFCIGPCCGDRSKVPRKTIPVNKWQLLLKNLQEEQLPVTVQLLEQEPHSPCVYSKGCLAVWEVCLPFSSQTRGSPFCVSVEKENHKGFLFFQCTLPKTRSQEMLVPAWESAGSSAVCSTKHMRLDHFASCLHATLSSPKMRLNSAK